MYIFDAHNDTLLKLLESNQYCDLNSISESHINLEMMAAGEISALIFAIFVPIRYVQGMALHKALAMIDHFWQNMGKYPDTLYPLLWEEDFAMMETHRGTGCILSLEGGEALEGQVGNLRNLFRLGVRVLSLTWNNRNDLADGTSEKSSDSGLSDFGRQIICEMNRLGMTLDVSHLSEKGFWEAIELSKFPVIASHSNANTLCSHRRNLSDSQIKAIGDSGGVIGVNFCPAFLANSDNVTIDHVIDQIMYLLEIGGSEAVGLGSDFDGISDTPKGLEDISTLPKVAEYLKKRGVSESVIDKVMGRNFITLAKHNFPKKSS